jgi:hypothetical protein
MGFHVNRVMWLTFVHTPSLEMGTDYRVASIGGQEALAREGSVPMLFDKSMFRISLRIGIDSENKGGWALLPIPQRGAERVPQVSVCPFNKNRVQSRVERPLPCNIRRRTIKSSPL